MKALFIALFPLLFFANIELEKRSLLDNKIEILTPKDFKEMSAELITVKYPGKNRPRLILTDEPGTTNLAFSMLENPADSTVIEAYKEAIKATYKKSFPTATWIKDGVTSINGKKVGFLKLVSQALDQKIYNYLFLTDVDGKLLLGTFNYLEKDMKEWEPLSEQIVRSFTVK